MRLKLLDQAQVQEQVLGAELVPRKHLQLKT